jgi:uncharacterized protein DUF6644
MFILRKDSFKMPILQLFRWLSHTPFSVFLRHSTWGFAAIETVHLLGLAALGGVILIVDLRLLGIGLRRQPISRVAQELWPVLLGSLGVMLISGVLLVVTGPLKYYHSPLFRLKMLLFSLATAFYFTLHRSVVRLNVDVTPSVRSKVAAAVSLALWLGVGLAGRAIGFL